MLRSRWFRAPLIRALPLLIVLGCSEDDDATNPSLESSWHAMPAPAGSTLDLVTDGTFLYAAGGWGGSQETDLAARWDGVAWQSLGRVTASGAKTIALYGGSPVVGGWFQTLGDEPLSYLVVRSGTGWLLLGAGVSGPVEALLADAGDLYIGGLFFEAGGLEVRSVTHWDGSAYRALGPGLNGPVYSLALFRGELIAAGSFLRSGADTVRNIAAWNGSAWRPLGEGTDGDVRALAVLGDDLIAGGTFLHAGGVAANSIARWNGTAWQPLGPGLTSAGGGEQGVHDLTIFQGDLVAGGAFDLAGTSYVHNVARWDGTAWEDLDVGVNGMTRALVAFGPDLIAGGLFDVAGRATVDGIARWGR
jgi:hypothetical protein